MGHSIELWKKKANAWFQRPWKTELLHKQTLLVITLTTTITHNNYSDGWAALLSPPIYSIYQKLSG